MRVLLGITIGALATSAAAAAPPRGSNYDGRWSVEVITDQGTYRFAPHDANPTATLQRVGAPVRGVAFGADGTFYQLDKDKIIATGPDGAQRWRAALTDGRKLVLGLRTLVWDGADAVWAIAADGTADALGVDGQIQDLVASADGKRAGVVLDGKRALVFDLQ